MATINWTLGPARKDGTIPVVIKISLHNQRKKFFSGIVVMPGEYGKVAGTFMLPNLPPGCYVALKRYNLTGGNPNTIPFGQIFGIVVEDEHTGEYHGHIKVLRRHKDPELAKSFWIAHSFNAEEYDDFDIAIQQVRSLWIVKQHIVSDTIY